MRALLVPVDGSPAIEIDKEIVTVGRKDDCDLYLDHKSVSKLHCVLARAEGVLHVRDLGSTNGTRVNGQRVRRAALLPNDHLHIASLHYRVQFAQDAFAAHANDRTQRIDASEVQRLIAGQPAGAQEDSSIIELFPRVEQPMRVNPLPDVYPEKPKHDK